MNQTPIRAITQLKAFQSCCAPHISALTFNIWKKKQPIVKFLGFPDRFCWFKIIHQFLINIDATSTLKVESFAGRNFRDFASFLGVRESLYPRNRTFIGVREILHEKSLKMASQ